MTACKSNLKHISNSIELYAAENDGAYPRSMAQLNVKFIKVMPTCPAAGADTYTSNYAGAASGYTVVCAGTYHKSVGRVANYPQYTSKTGLIDR